jgi:hypothetical protein
MGDVTDNLREYRSQLIEAEHKAQTAFDRTLLTLSGGALGLSLTFVAKFTGQGRSATVFLSSAWVIWAVSLICVLASHYFSTLAMRKAIEQLDKGLIYEETPGGGHDRAIRVLNGVGGLLFVLGVAAILIFAVSNAG